jgi:hypothetical protein
LEVTLYSPHRNQLKIHNSIEKEPYKYYVLNIGRQFGKSLLATNQLLKWCLSDNDCKAAWVSPIYKQAKKVFDEIDSALSNTGLVIERNKQELYFKFTNGSTLQFFSAERYDNIRGFTFHYLVCDEFAFMDSEAWTEVLRATVLVKGKKVLLISTPKGKNHFYHLHQLDGVNPQYKSFTMSSYDNPIINPTEIDDAKVTLPEHIFKQEYLAEFIDGGAGLFLNMTYLNIFETTNRYYAGVDLGRADDYTVLTIFNEKGQMVYCDRWRQNSWSVIVNEVTNKINQYKAYTMIEVNSVGDAIFEQIQNNVNAKDRIEPFVTTSKSKQDIIEQLIVANSNNEVQFLELEWLRKEFEVFTYEYNPKTKSIKYSAPNGFHDDGVMATAIAFNAYKQSKTRGVYSIR